MYAYSAQAFLHTENHAQKTQTYTQHTVSEHMHTDMHTPMHGTCTHTANTCTPV